jgi:hypothetical protein
MYPLPFDDAVTDVDGGERARTVVRCHQSSVYSVEVTSNEMFMFTCAADGSCIISVSTKLVDK